MKTFLLRLGSSVFATIGGALAAGVGVCFYFLVFTVLTGLPEGFATEDLSYLLSMSTLPLMYAFTSPFWVGLVLPWYLLSSYFAPRLLGRVNALLAGGVAGLLITNYYFLRRADGAPSSLGSLVNFLLCGFILGVVTALSASWLHRRESRWLDRRSFKADAART